MKTNQNDRAKNWSYCIFKNSVGNSEIQKIENSKMGKFENLRNFESRKSKY